MIKIIKPSLTLSADSIDHLIEKLSEKMKPLAAKGKYEPKDEDILNITQLSEYLNVSAKWIYEQTHLKTIPHIKMGNKQLRFRKKEIDKWFDGLKIPSARNPIGKVLFNKKGRAE